MNNERSNTGNQPNDQKNRTGVIPTPTPSSSTPTRPERDIYAEGAPDSSRQYGEAGRSSRTNPPPGGTSGTATQTPPSGTASRKPMPATGQNESESSGSCGTDACTPETGVNESSRQPATGKRNPVSGGQRDDEGGSA